MNNSAVIVKVEYKPVDEPYADFRKIDIIPYSGSLSDNIIESAAGDYRSVTLQFNIAKITIETDKFMASLSNREAVFRAHDANRVIHTLGDGNEFHARLTCRREVGAGAGSFNGYRCTVKIDSPVGAPVQ